MGEESSRDNPKKAELGRGQARDKSRDKPSDQPSGKQLILDVSLRAGYSFKNFIAGGNSLLITSLRQLVASPVGSAAEFCYSLYGISGSGKTHLLGAVMEEVAGRGRRGLYYPLKDLPLLDYEPLMSDFQPDWLCLDDLQAVLGNSVWERAVLACYNRRQMLKLPLLITLQQSPRAYAFGLPDLFSRLMAGLVFKLQPMTDEERICCLQQRATERGLTLLPSVARFLIAHYARDTHSLLAALDSLDRASLQQQRGLTIPFVKQILNI